MAQKHDVIDSTFFIKTPENIGFRHAVAGPFRRFPAYLIDLCVIGLLVAAIVIVVVLLGITAFIAGLNPGVAQPLEILGTFILRWFYFGLFETFMNGQTPGKWLLGLRTVSLDGQPINGQQAILRNLLRDVDLFILVPLGLIACAMNARYQRIGDLAAGTMVVIEESPWLTGMAKLDDPRTIQLAGYIPPEFTVNKTMAKAIATYVERRRFFSLPRRREMARNIAGPLLDQFGLPADTSYDLLLCALYYRAFVADRGEDEKNLAAARNNNPFAMLRSTQPARNERMKIAELLERRRKHWHELERLCSELKSPASRLSAPQLVRLAALYRAACADLALADAYHMPQNTVLYLHRLVGRAHNVLYRSRRFDIGQWANILLFEVPQRIFSDRCVQAAFLLFWGLFILSAYLAASPTAWPGFAEEVLGKEQIAMYEEMHESSVGNTGFDGASAAAFYIKHNTGIGLQCFAWGLLVIPGLLMTMFNAILLGTTFGHMARPDVASGANFFHFVTAHGPFELTAIVLSAGAGLRLGFSWVITRGMSRYDALRLNGVQAVPIMAAAAIMFMLAAFIEGFLSPSAAPYWIKATTAVVSTCMLAFYFGVLGFPREGQLRE